MAFPLLWAVFSGADFPLFLRFAEKQIEIADGVIFDVENGFVIVGMFLAFLFGDEKYFFLDKGVDTMVRPKENYLGAGKTMQVASMGGENSYK